jgi:two-component system sensor histidine kinase VicK
VRSSDEIGKLTNTFNLMASELKTTLSEIQSEKDKSETILLYMTDGVLAFDMKGEIIHINPAAKKLLNIEDESNVNFDSLFKDADISIEHILFLPHFKSNERRITTATSELNVHFAPFKINDKSSGLIVVIQDITEQERLDKARREFIANVSHELRTPLTTVKSYTETLADSAKDNNMDPSMFMAFLKVINSETDRMTRLVKDLLTLSKLDYGHRELKREDVDISYLVMGIVERMKINAAAKDVKLIYEPTNQLPIIMGDKDRLEQVIVNIISNAIKYTFGGDGEVFVSTGRMYQNVYIKIKDNGMGIPKDDLPHVFERFYRVDKARSREQGGTGLGLAISNEIIKEHGGKITISSDYGVGTEVIVMLPVDE